MAAAADADEEKQPEAVQQSGTEDADACFPLHTLQYLPSGEQHALSL